MPLPPEVDDAISPRSPLHPPRKSFAFALRTAAVPPGRRIGTRECSNVNPLRFRDTALAVLLRYLLQLRCCTPLPLCNTLFQRLSLLSDTSLVQSAFRQRLLAPFSTASRIVTVIAFFPQCGALALLAYGILYHVWRQSGFIANGTRRLTLFASPSTADNGTAVRAVIGRGRNRRLCQLPDLYASATPHSLCSYGVCSVARSLSRYRFVTHSFRQAAPKPTYAPTAFVLSSARSVLRTSIADNNTSIGCIDLTFLVLRLNARNWRCHD